MTVILLLALAAFGAAVVSAMGRCPLYVSVLLLCILVLVQQLPIGK